MLAPFLLRPDNFTPPGRTPWGGRNIVSKYKDLGPAMQGALVGESWEVSVEPDFPSRCAEGGETLAERVAEDPPGYLGREAAGGRRATALLVKLLDAADDLSVQIHPADDYRGLAPGESGKPESWYVLAREPGAGIYLGLRAGVTEASLREALEQVRDVSKLLAFVSVEPGDFFVIDAGTAHAVGRGVTLVEPQHVAPGCRGVTYRFWDWNRRYDAAGRVDAHGAPRALHVNDALAVTAWDAPREDALLSARRLRAGAPVLEGPATLVDLAGGTGVASEHLRVSRVAGTGALGLPDADVLRAVTVVAGSVRIEAGGASLVAGLGRSAVIPANASGVRLTLAAAHAVVSRVA